MISTASGDVEAWKSAARMLFEVNDLMIAAFHRLGLPLNSFDHYIPRCPASHVLTTYTIACYCEHIPEPIGID